MKEIKLTRGKVTIVDDEDFKYLSQWKWHFNDCYAVRSGRKPMEGRCTLSMHRVINQTPEGYETDHINRDKLDNRKQNLRTATGQQNMYNRESYRNSSSIYKGVYWDKTHNKWRVRIKINYKFIHIGRFDCEREAALAYNRKAKEVHGEFAGLNNLKR